MSDFASTSAPGASSSSSYPQTTSAGGATDFHSTPQFPHHVDPRTWLIVSGVSNIGLRLARQVLEHGDNVVLGVQPAIYDEVQAAAATEKARAGSGNAATNSGTQGLDHPFARYESEQLRQLLLDLDDIAEEAERRRARDDGDSGTSEDRMTSEQEENDSETEAGGSGHSSGLSPEASAGTTARNLGALPQPSSSSSSPSTSPSQRSCLRPVRLDPRAAAHCQAAVAVGVSTFGRVDIMLCNFTQVVIGTVEELGASDETLALVREQFEINFYSCVNAIKACLPAMRNSYVESCKAFASAGAGGVTPPGAVAGGHIIAITGVSGHLGTPGLGAYCAAGWALEGYCDSIAYEIAPFNIKVSIVQPHLETSVLPNQIKAAPSLPHYAPPSHPAPLARNVIGGLLDRISNVEAPQPATAIRANTTPLLQRHRREMSRESGPTDPSSGSDGDGSGTGGGGPGAAGRATGPRSGGDPGSRPSSKTLGSSGGISIHEPHLPSELLDGLTRETLFSVCAIAGHPNPPQRHIVGTEGVVSVKEKLRTVNTELEDMVGASTAVDVVVDTR